MVPGVDASDVLGARGGYEERPAWHREICDCRVVGTLDFLSLLRSTLTLEGMSIMRHCAVLLWLCDVVGLWVRFLTAFSVCAW